MDVITVTFAQSPVLPQEAWHSWNWDPLLIVTLLLGALFYAAGIRRLWRRAGLGRAISFFRVLAFGSGLLALAAALLSPLDRMSGALLSAHMVQHVLLMLVAAPLLVLGAPPVALGWMLPRSRPLARWWHRRTRLRRLWQTLSQPGLVWMLHLLVLWLWHIPVLYQAALADEAIHILEHTSFLGIASFFWWTLVYDRRLTRLGAALAAFSTMLLSGLLGALLVFSKDVWYPAYSLLPYGWGLTPLEDQQLAGAIMWVPAGLVYLAVTLALLGAALQGQGRKDGGARVVVAPHRQ